MSAATPTAGKETDMLSASEAPPSISAKDILSDAVSLSGVPHGAAKQGASPDVIASSDESPRHAEATQWLGTVLGLGAWTMFFVALSFAVGWYRLREPWSLPPGYTLGLGLSGLALLAGNLVLPRARRCLELAPASPRAALRFLGVAWGLGVLFLGQQAAWMHVAWWEAHLRIPEDGLRASSLYGLTALHALHVLALMGGLTWTLWRLGRGAEVRASVRRHVLGWHFVSVTWLLLFAAVYLP